MGAGAGAKGAAHYPKDTPPDELATIAKELPFDQQTALLMASNQVGLLCPDYPTALETMTPVQKDKIWVEMEVKYGQRFGRKPDDLPEGFINALRLEYVDKDPGAYGCWLEDNPLPEKLVPVCDQIESQVRDSSYPDEVLKSLEKAWSRPARISDWEWLEARAGSWNGAADAIIQKLTEAGVKRGQIASIDAHNSDPDSDAIFSAHFSKSLPDEGDLQITYDVQNTAEYGWDKFYDTAIEQASAVPTGDIIGMTSSCNTGGAGVTYLFKYAPASDGASRPLTWKESRSDGSDWKDAAKDILNQIKDSGAQRGQVLCIDAHNWGGQRAENEDELQEKRDKIAALKHEITQMTANIQGLQESLQEAEVSLANNKEIEASETTQRDEAKAKFEVDVKNLVDAAEPLEKTIALLTTYYDELDKKKAPAAVKGTFESRKSKGGEAITSLKSILSETKTEEATARSDEEAIQAAYEARVAECQAKEATLEDTIKSCKEQIEALEAQIAAKKAEITPLEEAAAEHEEFLSKRKAGDAIFTAVLDLERPGDGPLNIGFYMQESENMEELYDKMSKFANEAREDDGEYRVFSITSSCSKGGKIITCVFYEEKAGIVRFMPKPDCIPLEGYIAALRAEYVDRKEFALGNFLTEQEVPSEVRERLEPHIEAQIRSVPCPGTVIGALKRAWS
mmetsp:Transcript_80050/g.138945  ORF Transcript_80050/g.138945 Transcript_80050/m.138945 type:complete len:680 (+) Transcript_80050:187-2226(+)